MNLDKTIYLFMLLIALAFGQFTKSSITFVIDDTGSMGDDIDGVIEKSNLVFDRALNTNTSIIEDFLLVTFNDPEPGRLRIRTKDRDAFKRELGRLIVNGGGDCPELSMSGIELAIKESLPGSYIYVFTDASAKDADKLEAVQNLAIKKQSQVVFLLTGECYFDREDPNFLSFYKLARATLGQVFHIQKQDVEKILTYVAETIKNPKTVLAVKDLPPGYDHLVEVNIDAGISQIFVSVSGEDPKINKATAPDGTDVLLEDAIFLDNVLAVKMTTDKPGTYKFRVGSKTNTIVVTTGATNILFKHGFLPIEPTSMNDTATQPIQGVQTHLAIELQTTNDAATLNSVQITDMDGNVLSEMPLRLFNKTQKLYMTRQFLPPDSLFKITVKGYDKKTKLPFTRTSSTGIEPQKPEKPINKPPSVKVTENFVKVEYDRPLRLMCKFSGYPKPDTMWVGSNGTVLPSSEMIVASPYDYLNVLELDKVTMSGHYTCKSANALGDASDIVKVEVDYEKPEINKTTTVIHKRRGEDVEISCRINKGKPYPKITWFRQELQSIEEHFIKMNVTDDAFSLTDITEDQATIYMCTATNPFGLDQHRIALVVESPPYIQRAPTYVKSKDGVPTSLPCRTAGVPRPQVNWFLNGVKLLNDRKHHIYRDNSLRFTGSLENRGEFTCVAYNVHGTTNRTVLVDFIAPVTIQPPAQSNFTQTLGDDLVLPCRADGYPQPAIKWLFQSLDKKTTASRIRTRGESDLQLKNLRVEQGGHYVCVASNRESSANMTYSVRVQAPPSIEKERENTYVAVLGDLFLTLPCKAIGSPKPFITWSKNEFNIASGTEWYDIREDGTLIIKNIDNMSGGTYVCHAKNSLGRDSEMYQVNVKPYPDEVTPGSTIALKEGSTEIIKCDVPHSRLDSVRWYKDRRLINNDELTVRNAQFSDSGVYTCRVQALDGSTPKVRSVRIEVGSSPEFAVESETNINFEENVPTYLDCLSFGDPVPEVTWYAGETKLDLSDMQFDLTMTLDNRGSYTCVVSNAFGSINRTFEISSIDCLLDLKKDFNNSQPLITDMYGEWPFLIKEKDFLQIRHSEQVHLSCPGGFVNIPGLEAIGTCERDNKFIIDGNVYAFPELSCKKELEIAVRQTGRVCKGDNTEEIKIGYMTSTKFVEAYDICLDRRNSAAVYAKHKLQRSLAGIEPRSAEEWYDNHLPLTIDDAYDCDTQITIISSTLGKNFHADDKCCFKKLQLVNPRDLRVGLGHEVAFSSLNVVPQWSTCNSKNWHELEQRVRNLAKISYDDILVWTGTHGKLKLKNIMGEEEDIKLEDDDYRQQTVPEYIWKVVQDPNTRSSLAIVQLNIPDVTVSEAYGHMLCNDVCRDVPWMKGYAWRSHVNGYTFCCSLDQFEDVFGYRGHFGSANRNILYNVSPLPSRTL